MAKQPAATAAAAAAPAEVVEEQPKRKRSKKKLLLITLVLLLLAGGGAGAYFAMQPVDEKAKAAKEANAKAAAAKKPPVFLNLDNFVVNLRDEESEHYLQLGVVLEASSLEAVDEAKVQMPRIRNGILLLLSSKTAEELATMEGKQKLMDEIVAAARKPMPLPEPAKGIEGVYFSAFVIQ